MCSSRTRRISVRSSTVLVPGTWYFVLEADVAEDSSNDALDPLLMLASAITDSAATSFFGLK